MIRGIELRSDDVAECIAGGMEPSDALRMSIMSSHDNYVQSTKDGLPYAYWGVRRESFLTDAASVWCLTTPVVESNRVLFARESQRMVERLLYRYSRLECLVYAQHSRAIKWLEWLDFLPSRTIEINNEAFLVMYKERN